MKRQGYRDSLHIASYATEPFTLPSATGGFVPPAVLFMDTLRTLSITGGRQLSQAQTVRVVGVRFSVIDLGTDEITTTGGWVRGAMVYYKPTAARVQAHKEAMGEWFGELEEAAGRGQSRAAERQFLVKLLDSQPTLPEHSLDQAGLPFALSSAVPAVARDIFGEYDARNPIADVVVAGVQDQRQYASRTSPAGTESLGFTVVKSSGLSFAGLGANVDPAARAASEGYTGFANSVDQWMWFGPGHHLPVMTGQLYVIVLQAGPRGAGGAPGPFEASTDTMPDQTPDALVRVGVELLIEGWHPMAK